MNSNNSLLYVTIIAVTVIAAVVLLSIFAPTSNNIVNLIGFAGLVAGQIIQGQNTASKVKEVSAKVEETHKMVNSRLTELLETTGIAAKAEGRAEGVEAQKLEQANNQTN